MMGDPYNSSKDLPPENDDVARDLLLAPDVGEAYRQEHGPDQILDEQNAEPGDYYKDQERDYGP